MSQIPVIDLAAFASANERDRFRVVRQVSEALEEVGFLLISGHGVPDSLIDRVSKASLAFFDRPEEEKARFIVPGHPSRGFGANRTRTVGISADPTLLKSLQEGYGLGLMEAPNPSEGRGRDYVPNIWPDHPSDFEPAMREYYGRMQDMFQTIMRMFAVALDLPETFFDGMTSRREIAMRLTHYPKLDREPLPGEERAGAHTDTGIITILHIDETPDSLQVETRSKEWINVNKVPGTFVMNIGDLMMRWTNDRWTSNMHRVVNPPFVNGESGRRLSIVCFCSANEDALIECLPQCSGPGNPPRYEPILSGDYAAMRAALRYGTAPPAPRKAS